MFRLFFASLLALLLTAPGAAASRAVPLSFATGPACVLGVDGWTWYHVRGLQTLSDLPAGWRLMVDHTRHNAMLIAAASDRGSVVLRPRGEDAVSLGNRLSVVLPMPGRAITSLCIGMSGVDAPTLMRTVQAAGPEAYQTHREAWLMLVAAVIGVLGCALAYNLFLLLWLKSAFQRWYVTWLAAGIGYTALWSGVAAMVFPALGGNAGIRLNLMVVSVLIGSATAFFFDFMEEGVVPRRLRRIGLVSAAMVPVAGLAAAADMMVAADLSDILLNLAFLASILTIVAAVPFAVGRRSRAVWFYLAGWTPPLAVFGLRIARNFGLLPQSDAVDMASFAAIAFEAVILSLAIADRFRALRRDRDAAEAERETLIRVATTDSLTGCYNRSAFQQRLGEISEARAGVDLIAVDLDDLKEVNDIAGHDAGDALIAEAARRIREAAGPEAFVARLGGDEFVVLLVDAARGALADLLRLVETSAAVPLLHGGRRLSVSFCAGLARSAAGEIAPDKLYKQADLALYRAKSDGDGRWRRYTAGMGDEQERRRRCVEDIKGALARGELKLHYQPIVDLRTGDVLYHEALLRWERAFLGLLGPGDFAMAFEDAALAPAIQEHVLETALDQLRPCGPLAGSAAVSVNFMACQLQGRAGAERVLEMIRIRELEPHRLIVEVTETVVLGRPGGPVLDCLRVLRRAGVGVALDDFGTGYASLVHLRDMPADVLKIDRSFVAGVPTDAGSTKIVRAIVALAHSLGRKVIAEGIETTAQRDFLRRLGCDCGQGYLFGRPAALPVGDPARAADAA